MSETRIYAIENGDGDTRLVEASTQAQALRHVAKGTFQVRVANAKEVGAMVTAGTKIEKAVEAETEEAPKPRSRTAKE